MSTSNKFLALLILGLVFFGTSCEDDDPIIVDEEELITTLRYTLTPSGGGTAVTMEFQDLDGDGGNDPIITGGTLAANTTYTGAMELLNESETPVEVITTEIEEEDAEHQFFFSTSGGLDVAVAYGDADADGNPVGLASTLTTGAASSGDFTIILRHEPDKFGTGVKEGDITNAGGETDIEVVFPVTVQ